MEKQGHPGVSQFGFYGTLKGVLWNMDTPVTQGSSGLDKHRQVSGFAESFSPKVTPVGKQGEGASFLSRAPFAGNTCGCSREGFTRSNPCFQDKGSGRLLWGPADI